MRHLPRLVSVRAWGLPTVQFGQPPICHSFRALVGLTLVDLRKNPCSQIDSKRLNAGGRYPNTP